MNLNDKIAVVTGGTGMLGKAIVEKLTNKGCSIIIQYNKSKKKAQELSDSIKHKNVKSHIIQCDFSNPQQLNTFFSKGLDPILKNRKFDFLINNAVVIRYSSNHKSDLEYFDEILSVNLKAPYFLMMHSLERMNNGGSVINISSMTSQNPLEGSRLYGASKAALDNISKSFITTYKEKNISLHTLVPGIIYDGVKNIRMNNISLDLSKSYIKKILKDKFKVKNVVSINEIAEVLVSLCSSAKVDSQFFEIKGSYIL